MKKIFLLLFIISCNFLQAQNTYPKKVIINKDTVFAITGSQMDEVLITRNNLKKCSRINDTLLKKIDQDSILIIEQIGYQKSLEHEIKLSDSLNYAQKKVIIMQNNNVDSLNKEIDRKNTIIKITTTSSIILLALLIIL